MDNEQEKESENSGILEIIKLDETEEKDPSSKTIPSVPHDTEKKEEDNDARYDPGIYQLKSERLEKTLMECEKEIMFLVDLLKNKIPKTEEDDG